MFIIETERTTFVPTATIPEDTFHGFSRIGLGRWGDDQGHVLTPIRTPEGRHYCVTRGGTVLGYSPTLTDAVNVVVKMK